MKSIFRKLPAILLVLSSFGLHAQNITLYLEDFEVDGDSSRYYQSHEFFGDRSYFQIGESSDFPDLSFAGSISGVTNTHFVASEYTTRATGAPANGIVSMVTRPILVDSFSNLTFTFDIAANNNLRYDGYFRASADWVDVDVRFDGGAWTRVMQFRAGPNGNTENQRIYEDVDLDNIGGDGDGGTILSTTMTRFSRTVVVSGSLVEFRVRQRMDFNGEEVVFDRIVVEGTPLNSPSATLNRMLYPYMGNTINNSKTPMWARPHPSAINYEFEISASGFTTQSVFATNRRLRLSDVPGITYNKTYNLRHRIITSGGPGEWSDAYYGFWPIKLNNPEPQVVSSQCGATLQFLNDNISVTDVGGATNYRALVQGPLSGPTLDTTYEFNSSMPIFKLSDAGAVDLGTYEVTISAFVDGDYSQFGQTCEVNVSTGLQTLSFSNIPCGGTLTNANQTIFTDNVPQAVSYRWRLQGDGDPYSVVDFFTTENKIKLADAFPNIAYGENYTLRVRYNDGISNSTNAICNFTLGSPVINISSPSCGSTISSYDDKIWAEYVGGASHQFTVFNTFFDTLITNSGALLKITDLDTSLDLSTINVAVRPIITGVPTVFGDTCTFTFNPPPSMNSARVGISEINNFESRIYPVPFENELFINFSSSNVSKIEIYDVFGSLKYDYKASKDSQEGQIKILTSGFSSGHYFIKIFTSEGEVSSKHVIKK